MITNRTLTLFAKCTLLGKLPALVSYKKKIGNTFRKKISKVWSFYHERILTSAPVGRAKLWRETLRRKIFDFHDRTRGKRNRKFTIILTRAVASLWIRWFYFYHGPSISADAPRIGGRWKRRSHGSRIFSLPHRDEPLPMPFTRGIMADRQIESFGYK